MHVEVNEECNNFSYLLECVFYTFSICAIYVLYLCDVG